jgi:hypothetical protein
MAHARYILDTKGYKHTIRILLLPLQQWLHEHAPMLRGVYIVYSLHLWIGSDTALP